MVVGGLEGGFGMRWVQVVDSGSCGGCGLSQSTQLSCYSRPTPQKMVESQRQNVLGEFERLRRLLAEEEQQLLQKLEEEELEVLPRLREGAARLGQQSTQLAALITELEGRCQLPALGLLQVSRQQACVCMAGETGSCKGWGMQAAWVRGDPGQSARTWTTCPTCEMLHG